MVFSESAQLQRVHSEKLHIIPVQTEKGKSVSRLEGHYRLILMHGALEGSGTKAKQHHHVKGRATVGNNFRRESNSF